MGAALLAAAPSAAHAQPQDLFVERTAMSAAGDRCGLFAPEVSAALAAGAAQARSAALRAGVAPNALAAARREATRRAASLDCRSPRVTEAAARVREAFSGYARVTRMTYPGDLADWRADRSTYRVGRWRLSQESRFPGGRMTFGLAGRDTPGVLVAVAEFADGSAPYSARLLVRDGARTLGPYLLAAGGRGPLNSRLPRRSALKAYLAEARAPAEAELLPRDGKSGWTFRFPAEAIQALAGLDPRESVAVEFLLPYGRTATAYVEVGDFAAGRAFLKLATR
jgi:hypothetical protein